MQNILFSPPVVFIGFLVLLALSMRYLKRYAAVYDENNNERTFESYASGERNYSNYVNPNYMQFFRYAFIFSVMHVLALVVASAPKGTTALPIAYIAAGVLALVIIFRK